MSQKPPHDVLAEAARLGRLAAAEPPWRLHQARVGEWLVKAWRPGRLVKVRMESLDGAYVKRDFWIKDRAVNPRLPPQAQRALLRLQLLAEADGHYHLERASGWRVAAWRPNGIWGRQIKLRAVGPKGEKMGQGHLDEAAMREAWRESIPSEFRAHDRFTVKAKPLKFCVVCGKPNHPGAAKYCGVGCMNFVRRRRAAFEGDKS